MAGKRNGHRDDERTNTTMEDLLREISSKLDELKRLDAIEQRLATMDEHLVDIDGHLVTMDKRIDHALRRDQAFEGKVAKLELRMTKLEKKLA